MKDLHVQGRGFLGDADGVSEMAPKKNKIKRLPGRSKSLVDASSNSKHFCCSGDASRTLRQYPHSFLRRAPTQDDIYKILNETSEIIRPSTSKGESKRLSPYVPLPAIGDKYRQIINSDNEVTEIPDTTLATSGDDNAHKLVREGTYNVLEPRFVKGPIVNDSDRNTYNNFKKKKKKEISRNPENQFQESSAAVVFGPRLQKEEEGVIGEDLMPINFPVQEL